MKIGLLLPQGYFDEFAGWTPVASWERILDVARLAARSGVRHHEDTLADLDPLARVATTATGRRLSYDVVSIGIGSVTSDLGGVQSALAWLRVSQSVFFSASSSVSVFIRIG